jgi:hypothetical protein
VESRGPSVGMVAECEVASQHSQGCSPLLCRLRTDGLAPSKPNSLSSIGAWLKRTALMVVLGEKLRRVLQATQPG